MKGRCRRSRSAPTAARCSAAPATARYGCGTRRAEPKHASCAWGIVSAMALSPDGRLVTTAQQKVARVWDVATDGGIATLRGHDYYVWTVAFSPDGQMLLAAQQTTPCASGIRRRPLKSAGCRASTARCSAGRRWSRFAAPSIYQPTRMPVVHERPEYPPPSSARSFMSAHCRPVCSFSL
jgi:WD domain, G-beta repeat